MRKWCSKYRRKKEMTSRLGSSRVQNTGNCLSFSNTLLTLTDERVRRMKRHLRVFRAQGCSQPIFQISAILRSSVLSHALCLRELYHVVDRATVFFKAYKSIVTFLNRNRARKGKYPPSSIAKPRHFFRKPNRTSAAAALLEEGGWRGWGGRWGVTRDYSSGEWSVDRVGFLFFSF